MFYVRPLHANSLEKTQIVIPIRNNLVGGKQFITIKAKRIENSNLVWKPLLGVKGILYRTGEDSDEESYIVFCNSLFVTLCQRQTVYLCARRTLHSSRGNTVVTHWWHQPLKRSFLTLGAHAQRELQYLVCPSVRVLPRFLQQTGKKATPTSVALHSLFLKWRFS